MKLLVDVNLSPLWIPFFALHGFEAVHWSSVGNLSAPDTQILNHAAAEGFVIFTHDLDFGTLLAQLKSDRPSVLQIRGQDVMPAQIGEMVLRALEGCRGYLESGALVTVEESRHRMRILPI